MPLEQVSLDDTSDEASDDVDDINELIADFVDRLHDKADDMYTEHKIPKNDGSMRLLEEPAPELKKAQNLIKNNILYKIRPTDSAFGFRRGISLVEAAKKHVGKPIVIRMDITEFFHNNTGEMVLSKLKEYLSPDEYEPIDLRKMVKTMTKDNRLPMGAPSSPPATNIVCRRLDSRIQGICEQMEQRDGHIEVAGERRPRHTYEYTRYADDLVISSDDADGQSDATDIIPQVREIVEDEQFEIKERKTRIMRKGKRQTVLGMTVNAKTNIPREKRENMRARLDNLYKDLKRLEEEGEIPRHVRPDGHPNRAQQDPVDIETGRILDRGAMERIAGYIAFALDVNELYGERWQEKYNEIEEMAEEQGYI